MMGLENRQSIAAYAPPIADMPNVRLANPVLCSNGMGWRRSLPSECMRKYAHQLEPDHSVKPLFP